MQRSERRLGSGSGKGALASPSERRGTSWRAPTGSISFVRHADAFRRRQFAGVSARPGDPASGAGAVPALRNDLWGRRLVIWRRPPECRVRHAPGHGQQRRRPGAASSANGWHRERRPHGPAACTAVPAAVCGAGRFQNGAPSPGGLSCPCVSNPCVTACASH